MGSLKFMFVNYLLMGCFRIVFCWFTVWGSFEFYFCEIMGYGLFQFCFFVRFMGSGLFHFVCALGAGWQVLSIMGPWACPILTSTYQIKMNETKFPRLRDHSTHCAIRVISSYPQPTLAASLDICSSFSKSAMRATAAACLAARSQEKMVPNCVCVCVLNSLWVGMWILMILHMFCCVGWCLQ